jgi:hypothetical protein
MILFYGQVLAALSSMYIKSYCLNFEGFYKNKNEARTNNQCVCSECHLLSLIKLASCCNHRFKC